MVRAAHVYIRIFAFALGVFTSIPGHAIVPENYCVDGFARFAQDLEASRGKAVAISDGSGYIINGISITGPKLYPLSLVQKNLDLTDPYLDSLPRSTKILSVGEGRGDLAPTLYKRFPHTRAVDLWYHQSDLPESLARYVRENSRILMSGDATQLPIETATYDLVVSHMLINNLLGPTEKAAAARSIDEMTRVLAPGGEARISFYDVYNQGPELITGLIQTYGPKITVSSTVDRSGPRPVRLIRIRRNLDFD